jgi:isoleucyl-tRNA synthetase
MLAPILAFTAEEIWAAMPHGKDVDCGSVLFSPMPEPKREHAFTPEREAMWDKLLSLRTDVNKALELARADKVIGKPLDAEVTLYVDGQAAAAVDEISGQDLKTLFIVSAVDIVKGSGGGHAGIEFPGVTVSVGSCSSPKCARCWTHDKEVGRNADHPELCPRCLEVVSGR